MERAEGDERIDWDELVRRFDDVVAGENETLKMRALIEYSKMWKRAPSDVVRLTVPSLLELVAHERLKVQEAAAYCLKCIATDYDVSYTICRLGTTTLLILLENFDGFFQRVLLQCVRNLVIVSDRNRLIWSDQDSINVILELRDYATGYSKRLIHEIMSAMTLVERVRMFLLDGNMFDIFVEGALYGSMITRTMAAQGIGLLAVMKRTRPFIFQINGIRVLMRLFAEGDDTAKAVTANAMGLICSHPQHIRLSGVITMPLYAELLCGSDPVLIEIAEDVLCVLAAEKHNAATIVGHLVRLLRGDNGRAKAVAADIIGDISSFNHSSLMLQNSIPIIVKLMMDESLEVRKKVSGAILQLSQKKDNRALLAGSGAIDRLINILEAAETHWLIRYQTAETLVNFSWDPILRELVSCIAENPVFRNMQRNMLIRMRIIADQHRRPRGYVQSTTITDLRDFPD